MTKVQNMPNSVRYDLYLSVTADERLIAHLDTFKATRRVGQEMRRMLYQALDGVYPAAAAPRQTMTPVSQPAKSNYTVPAGTTSGAASVETKLKNAFGKPE